MLDFGILRLVNLSMECLCIAPLTPTVIVIRGFVSQPLFCMLLISGIMTDTCNQVCMISY
jgi:hypothetical protein